VIVIFVMDRCGSYASCESRDAGLHAKDRDEKARGGPNGTPSVVSLAWR
jgi:hypothetical protein